MEVEGRKGASQAGCRCDPRPRPPKAPAQDTRVSRRCCLRQCPCLLQDPRLCCSSASPPADGSAEFSTPCHGLPWVAAQSGTACKQSPGLLTPPASEVTRQDAPKPLLCSPEQHREKGARGGKGRPSALVALHFPRQGQATFESACWPRARENKATALTCPEASSCQPPSYSGSSCDPPASPPILSWGFVF